MKTKKSKQDIVQFNLALHSHEENDVTVQHKLNIKDKTRASVLPWRGQFSPQLVEYLLETYCAKNGHVLDPFCGSGTVLYESANKGMSAVGLDINPAAILLAKSSLLCSIPFENREDLRKNLANFVDSLKKKIADDGYLSSDDAVQVLVAIQGTEIQSVLNRACLLTIFKDAIAVHEKSLTRALTQVDKLLAQVPFSQKQLTAEIGDSRDLPFSDSIFDYIVTSPPYINVFNYHQNYRPIVEAMGYIPLQSARAEIGANRKFRQNRFITVVQYCIDMALFLVEAGRVLNENGVITIVLGRVSSVRGISFENGKLVADIAKLLGGLMLDWKSRSFLNRFGVDIFEEVLTIRPTRASKVEAVDVGRKVGLAALNAATKTCDICRIEEIRAAIEAGASVDASPYILR